MNTLNKEQFDVLLANAQALEDGNFAICAQVNLIELFTVTSDDKQIFVVVENELHDGQDAIFNSSCDIKDAFEFYAAYSFDDEDEAFKFYTDYILNNR